MPILVNKKMHRLIHEILGIPFIDADVIWQELSLRAEKNKYNPGLIKKKENLYELYHRLDDGSIWCFKKSVISAKTEDYVQIEAVDISSLASIADEINADKKSPIKRINLFTTLPYEKP